MAAYYPVQTDPVFVLADKLPRKKEFLNMAFGCVCSPSRSRSGFRVTSVVASMTSTQSIQKGGMGHSSHPIVFIVLGVIVVDN
jgi:hypothetical protein